MGALLATGGPGLGMAPLFNFSLEGGPLVQSNQKIGPNKSRVYSPEWASGSFWFPLKPPPQQDLDPP